MEEKAQHAIESDEGEIIAVRTAVAAFLRYSLYAHKVVQLRRQAYVALPQNCKDVVSGFYLQKLRSVDKCIATNAQLCQNVANTWMSLFMQDDDLSEIVVSER
jgi:hypothetical protein